MAVGNLAVQQKKRFTIPPMAIVAGIVVVLGLAGFWYLDRISKQPPAGPAALTGAAKSLFPAGQTRLGVRRNVHCDR